MPSTAEPRLRRPKWTGLEGRVAAVRRPFEGGIELTAAVQRIIPGARSLALVVCAQTLCVVAGPKRAQQTGVAAGGDEDDPISVAAARLDSAMEEIGPRGGR